MAKPKIPAEIKLQADAIVARFNVEQLKNQSYAHYVTNYRGANLYLGHERWGKFWPVCRLTYTGDMEDWEFAIYKYSDEHYDPEKWFFTGAEEVDGTIEGAMRAGLKAYPP
ncbi:MAG: hypothetical protein AUK03_14035 [Anaerolineae bacterium CG2_30_64_16]|nr:MAG: hypothetical protein AUK03_14035 [Anaerolineae bacterium CG2_30_64_16]